MAAFTWRKYCFVAQMNSRINSGLVAYLGDRERGLPQRRGAVIGYRASTPVLARWLKRIEIYFSSFNRRFARRGRPIRFGAG